jgi:ribosomal protein S2
LKKIAASGRKVLFVATKKTSKRHRCWKSSSM